MNKKNDDNDSCFASSEQNDQQDAKNDIHDNDDSMIEKMQDSINDNAIEELIMLKQTIDENNEKIDALTKDCEDYKNSLIRMKADFENFKKRIREEEKDKIKYANQRLITDMLPILDDFDRAVESGENLKDMHAFYEGIKLIAKSLHDLLEKKYYITMVNEADSHFDPLKHEAVSVIDDPNTEGLKVKKILQKGYVIETRVLRPAKVIAVRGKKGFDSNNKSNEDENTK